MKERPILFSGSMVRAILDGRKTQTRRVVDFKKIAKQTGATSGKLAWSVALNSWAVMGGNGDADIAAVDCPYGEKGDRLWVRETWGQEGDGRVVYREDRASRYFDLSPTPCPTSDLFFLDSKYECERWRPSIFMPRWASRITLEVTGVRVERLNDISEEDARDEGAEFGLWYPDVDVFSEPTDDADIRHSSYRQGYGFLWESINGPGSWDLNPWVWVIEFRKATQ